MHSRSGFRHLRAAVALAVCLAACLAAAGASAQTSPPAYRPGEILIRFRDAAPAAARHAIRDGLGADQIRRFPRSGIELLRISGGSVENAVDRYRDDPAVEFVEPNYIWKASLTPNDPLFPNLWGMHNTGQTGGTAGADIKATQAWSVFTGSPAIVVGIIDTGIDYGHPDLAANIYVNPGEVAGNGVDDDGNGFIDDVRGWDFVNDDNDPMDDYGHGTHVAGTVAAVGNNGLGVAGVSWSARLLPLKFLDSNGYGSTSGAIAAIDYAAQAGARVINASWGGGGFSQALRDAIQAAGEAGVVFVAAAGNSGLDTDVYPNYPSAYDLSCIVAVAATTARDELAYFSSWGSETVDLAAPGENIWSSLPGGTYGAKSGTSMATPHVAGALALLLGRFPAMSVGAAKATLLSRVDPLPALAGRVLSGGRLDALGLISDPDETPPQAIADLTVAGAEGDHATLRWTASGDDGAAGTAYAYDLRYSTAPLTEENFAAATPAIGEPEPAPAGSSQETVVRGLAFEAAYYFAIKVSDETGNASGISNVAAATTLGPPDVAAAPAALAADLLTGQTAARTLTLTNSGASELGFQMEIEADPSGLAVDVITARDGVPDPVLARGTPVPLDRLPRDLPTVRRMAAAGGTAIDAVPGAAPNPPGPGYRALSPTEEVFGGDDNPFYGGPRSRGNIFHCTTARRLKEHRLYLRPDPGAQLWFLVYEGETQEGLYSLVSAAQVSPVGTSLGWYSSGDVDLPLAAGRYYLIAGSFSQPAEYYNRFGITPYPIPASFGELIAGAGWTWAPTANFPPDPLQGVPPEAFGEPAAYYQTLVTDVATSWLSVAPAGGAVPSGQALDLAVTLDASGLFGGDYAARLAVLSNDPDEPRVEIPVRLHVTGAPDIAVQPEALDFGTPFVPASRVDTVTVRNVGTDLLTVSEVAVTPAVFTADAAGFALQPGEERALTVRFRPDVAGESRGTLVVRSDDPDQAEVVVTLHGIGLEPPDIAVTPGSLSADLYTGESTTRTLTIANSGVADLTWRISRGGSGAAATPLVPAAAPVAQSRAVLGTVTTGAAGDTSAATRQGLRVEYGGAGTGRVLMFSDDPYRVVGSHYLDEALRTLGVAYTAIYYDGGGFGAAVSEGGWDLIIVGHQSSWPTAEWWDELERYQDGGGQLLVSTFDVDGSSSTASGLWQAIGVEAAGDLGTAQPVAWWEPSHPIFNDPDRVPPLARMLDSYADNGDRLRALDGTRSPAGFVAAPAAGQTAIAISGDERAIVNGFVPEESNRDEDGDHKLDVIELLQNEIHFLLGAGGWLAAEPRFGVVPAGGSQEVTVRLDARRMPGGEYRDDLVVESDDPDEPEVAVPVTLRVTGAADIVLVGAPHEVSSTKPFTVAGGSTTHDLAVPVTTGAQGDVDLVADGDYGDPQEEAVLSIEGQRIGAAGSTGSDCSPARRSFVLTPAQLEEFLADGVVHLQVQNSASVGVFCPLNTHTVRLRFREPAGGFDAGVQFVGGCRWESLLVVNQGTDSLRVTSATADGAAFTIRPASFVVAPGASLPLGVGFCPPAAGTVRATLVLESNDPDQARLEVALSGIAAAPPDLGALAESLFAEMGPNETVTRTLTLANTGGGPLVWRARAVESESPGGAGAGAGFTSPAGISLPQPLPVPPGEVSLERVLESLDADFAAVTAAIPGRYDFSEGRTGNSIADGGLDMYDGGNYLSTDLGSYLEYSDGGIRSSAVVGPNGRYFTRKYPGLFVLAADLDGVASFLISGDLGANGSGTADGAVLDATRSGRGYRAFVKRVFGAGDPSVNHMVIVPEPAAAAHTFSANTNSDEHQVSGLTSRRIYYLLYAAAGGARVDDTAAQGVLEVFLAAARLGPARLSVSPTAGAVPAGGSAELQVAFHSAGLIGGDYDTQVLVESNDPDAGLVTVPTRLRVLGIPDVAVAPAALEFDTTYVGGSRAGTVTVRNIGSDVLTVSAIAVSPAAFTAAPAGFALAPGHERTVAVTFAPLEPGTLAGALVVHSDDPDEAEAAVALGGVATLPPDLAVSPGELAADLLTGQTATRTLTVANPGGSTLTWEMYVRPLGGSAAGEPPAVVPEPERETLGMVPTGRAAGDTAAAYREAVRLRYGSAGGPRVLLYSDDPWRLPGGHYADAALQRLGLAYTGVYYHASAFLQTLAAGGWDIVVVAHEDPDSYATWWVELEGYLRAGGRLLISTPDADGSQSESTTLWSTVGLVPSGSLATARPVYWWQPAHPLFHDPQGVPPLASLLTSFSDNGDLAAAVNGATSPAGFQSAPATGQSAIVISADGRAIVNTFVPEECGLDADGDHTLDAIELLENEIHYLTQWAGWLTAAPTRGVLAPGNSQEVAVLFDAAGMVGGDFTAELAFTSNDPDEADLAVPARLHVTGVPDISVTPGSLDFGSLYLGQTKQLGLEVSNLGTDLLTVSAVEVSPAVFTAAPTSFTLTQGQKRVVAVSFAPAEVGAVAGALVVHSDDPDEGEVAIGLSGVAQLTPDIAVTPSALAVDLDPNLTTTRTVTVTNTGGGPLAWTAYTRLMPQYASAVTAADSAAARAALLRQRMDSLSPEWIVFHDDMEQGLNGWSTDACTGSSFWHQTRRAAQSADHSWWCGDEARGDYDVGRQLCDGAISPLIDLHGTVAPVTLQFYENMSTEPGHDETYVEMSSNKTTWTRLRGAVSGTTSGWRLTSLDLSSYAGKGYYLRFYFNTWNNNNQYPGWFVDDVLVTSASPPWVAVAPAAGELAPGASADLTVTFDSHGLPPGTLAGEVVIASNDPDENPVIVPAQLHVPGVPDIAFSEDHLDFGSVPVGESANRALWVQNVGNDVLTVTRVAGSSPLFRAEPRSLTLQPNESRRVGVDFVPVEVGEVTGNLIVRSDDPEEPEVLIPLRGTGTAAPDIAVTPAALDVELSPGETRTEILTIANEGAERLTWSAQTRLVPPGGAAGDGGLAEILRWRLDSLSPQAIVFYDNVEQGLNGWTTVTYQTDDLWHQGTRRCTSPTHSWWCGVEAQGNYATGKRIGNAVITPAVDLRGKATPIKLEFFESLDTEPGWDYCDVDVSMDDGVTWIPWRGPASGDSEGWRAISLDLSFFADRVIKVRFYFHTLDADNNDYPGWFFDDVLISSGNSGWITLTPASGYVWGGEAIDIAAIFDGSALPPGTYQEEILFISNDPDENPVVVPVRTTVNAASTVAVAALPEKFSLAPVAPNPARGEARIDFELPRAGAVRAAVFDVGGRKVRTLTAGEWPAGKWWLAWDGKDEGGARRGPGVYLVRLEGPDGGATRRFVWIP